MIKVIDVFSLSLAFVVLVPNAISGQNRTYSVDNVSATTHALRGNWIAIKEIHEKWGTFANLPVRCDLEQPLNARYGTALGGLVEYANHSMLYGNIMTGIRLFKEYGADMNAGYGDPLRYAVQSDLYDKVVLRLLEYGADPNLGPDWTPLCFAAGAAKARNITILLKAGADPNRVSKSGTSFPLMVAARTAFGNHPAPHPEYLACIRALVEGKADVNLVAPTTGRTALHAAAENNKPEAVKLLLKLGAKKRARDKQGKTPLDLARLQGSKECFALLK